MTSLAFRSSRQIQIALRVVAGNRYSSVAGATALPSPSSSTSTNTTPRALAAPPSRRWYRATTAIRGENARTSIPWPRELVENTPGGGGDDRPSWSDEWKRLGLGAKLVAAPAFPPNLFFVQLGFGVDQHGDLSRDGFATKAAVRAVRNAIEFNSIPGVIDRLPGGRHGMLVHVKLGVPAGTEDDVRSSVDPLEVAKVFPYGKLLPLEVVTGGLEFHSGRVVEELGDADDVGICVAACVTIGYETKGGDDHGSSGGHTTYSTQDGY